MGKQHAAELAECQIARTKKAAPVARGGFSESVLKAAYFFFAAALRFSSIAAWAAARRATGTRYGEQLT